MTSYLNVKIKCPVCGEDKRVKGLGKVNIDGLDPIMEAFECENVMYEYGEGEKWLTVISKTTCGTTFYIAPLKVKRDSPQKRGAENTATLLTEKQA